MNNNAQYLEKFAGDFENLKDRRYIALQIALDTRKFEIELYWKRATYFWAFLALAFTGFFRTIDKGPNLRSFAIASIGFIISCVFLYVHKGSKFWQENWENQVAVLAEPVVGPLFSYVLSRPHRRRGWLSLLDPSAVSVSRVNHLLTAYLALVWVGFMLWSTPNLGKYLPCVSSHPYCMITAFTVAALVMTHRGSGSNLGGYQPKARPNRTEISSIT